jgi:hypothetical protein
LPIPGPVDCAASRRLIGQGICAVVDEDGGIVLDVASGAVVVVLVDVVVVVVVVVVDDEVVVVVLPVGDGDVVVVVVGGATPLITPPTVVPEFGPPKIEDRERPALTSTRVTTPRARMNAASAEAVPTTVRRHRLSMPALSRPDGLFEDRG